MMGIPFLLEYLRMVCYSVVILTDLRNITRRKFSSLLYIGDVIIAFALLATASNIPFTGFPQAMVANRIITPAAVIWATIHFKEFLDDNHLTKKGYKSTIKQGDKK